jgi:long-chain acyl-CoA synthetase
MAGLMAGAEPMTEPADTRPDDPALILFTSGTIGEQKGVVLSHFNIFLQGSYMAETFWEVGPDDVVLMVAPGAHLFGQTLIHVAARAQAPLVMLNGFQPVAFLSAIQDEGVTFFAGVPTILHFMLNQPSVGDFDLSSLRKVMIGGAPLHPQVAREFEDRFEAKVITGYGLTEGVPLSYLAAEDMQDAPAGSIGRASLGTTLRVVDEQGDDVLPGEPGEIVARSPFLFQAYYDRPDLTEQAWQGGWFHTGDIGRVDPDGYFFLIDRLKDVIKRKGYSVYPAEVEQVLMSHPAVSGAGVVGVPDEALGEEVKAVVTLRQGKQATEEELISYCKERLAAYKHPRRIEFRDKLPMNPSGKVLRRALRGA